MTKFLITFPSAAMNLSEEEWIAAGVDSHEVIREIKAAGAYVFGGGINEGVAPVTVAADGTASEPIYSQLDGGFTVIEVPTRDEATHWAAKIAAACRCPQEVREFQYDPES